MKAFYFFMLIFLFATCKKANLKTYNQEIIGDYEWYYSVRDLGDSYSFDSHPDKYGIRIKSNSKLFIFKNDEIIYKGTIESISHTYFGGHKLQMRDKDLSVEFEISEDILNSENWPFQGYKNEYKKIN
jgi:hypothetical protein